MYLYQYFHTFYQERNIRNIVKLKYEKNEKANYIFMFFQFLIALLEGSTKKKIERWGIQSRFILLFSEDYFPKSFRSHRLMKVFKCTDRCKLLQKNWLWKRFVLIGVKKKHLAIWELTLHELVLWSNNPSCALTKLSHSILKQRQIIYISILQLRKMRLWWLSHEPSLATILTQIWQLNSKPELHPPHLFLGGTCSSSSSCFSASAPWKPIHHSCLCFMLPRHESLLSIVSLYQNAGNHAGILL